jgi:hypothetical protein
MFWLLSRLGHLRLSGPSLTNRLFVPESPKGREGRLTMAIYSDDVVGCPVATLRPRRKGPKI